MFKNIPFILRRFSRQRLTTSLHIVGLTLGITVCLLIGLFIKFELSFDTYHSKADRIYRVNTIWTDPGEKHYHFSSAYPLAEAIRKEIPLVEKVTRIHNPYQPIIEITPEKRFKQDRVMMTDPEFFDVFDAKVLQGDGREALRKPYQALLTESTAKKFFGTENAMGKVFKFKDKYNITVAGILADFPGNTHLPASMFLSLSADEGYVGTSLTQFGSVSGGSTFVLLPKGMNPKRLDAGLKAIYDRAVNNDPHMPKGSRADVELQPLRDIHFNSKYADGGFWVKAINIKWLWFFGSVGLAVLILACINFINLSTAQALTRAKEVGVRKTIGAGKFQLIRQFLTEALLLVSFSAILGILITRLSLPYINNLVEKQIRLNFFESPLLLGSLIVGILFTSLMAGLYPAWIISKFRPAETLKSGSVNSNYQSAILRKGLVITQFSISVCLLIALLLIGTQMNYMRSKNLGFEKDNIVLVQLPFDNISAKKELFKNELSRIPQIKDLSFSTGGFNGDNWGTIMSLKDGDDPERQEVTTIMTDDRFCKMYGLHLKAGRFFEARDTNAVSNSLPEGQRFPKSIVNEKLVKALGFESDEAALGKRFWIGMNGWRAEIIGVVQDFNTSSLHEQIKPTLITQYIPFCDKAGIKIKTGSDVPQTIAHINQAFKKVYTDGVFEFNFLDQQLDALYKTEARLYALFKIFSVLAMLISCLGLWGLVTFAAQQRVKEIGIRKVLGASVPNIVTLITKDFILLVSIALIIAAPLAYWGVNKWLQDFAYRITIDWKVFALAGAIALLIALVTVSFQAIKAAIANPIKSLRTE